MHIYRKRIEKLPRNLKELTAKQFEEVEEARETALMLLASVKGSDARAFISTYLKIKPKNLDTFRDNFIKPIRVAVNNLKQKNFLNDINENCFAYVYPNDSEHIIYLGKDFWDASVKGFNSRAGTLIHEASHWLNVLGTEDYAYGEDEVIGLTKDESVRNADSIEFVAESFSEYIK